MSTIKAWEEVGREQVFKKYSRAIDKVVFKLPDGSVADFYIKAESPVVSILALTEHSEVILVRQYRPGPKKILHELPGGFIDQGEDPLQAAEREFLEETGYVGSFELVGTCLDDAYSTLERYCFVATQCKKVSQPKNNEKTEQTQVVLVPLSGFREQLKAGKMTDVEVGYMGLDYLNYL